MRDLTRNGLQIFGLTALAVGQPILDMLGRQPLFLLSRNAHTLDVLLLIAILFVLLPAGLVAIEFLADGLSTLARRLIHVLVVGVLSALLTLLVLKPFTGLNPAAALAAALLIGIAAGAASDLSPRFRTYLSWLAVAVLISPALFLARPAIREVLAPAQPPAAKEASKPHDGPPVVLVIMDGLPVTALLTQDLRVNATRFPSFAALAARSTWYRNATTVGNVTDSAVPAILTGKYPTEGATPLPTADAHPRNLFTLLGGYRLYVRESLTRLLNAQGEDLGWPPPPAAQAPAKASFPALLSDLRVVYLHLVLPAALASRLPSINRTWGDFDAAAATTAPLSEDETFAALASALRSEDRPPLVYFHTWAAHPQGWGYDRLPSGATYPVAEGLGAARDRGDWAFVHAVQRSQLQIQCADAILGRIVKALEARGIYDRCLFIVTADHGTSLLEGRERVLDTVGMADVVGVPLFVKLPGQRTAAVDERNAETIDILPTIADVVRIPLEGPVDGRSLIQPASRPGKRVYIEGKARTLPPAVSLRSPILRCNLERLSPSLYGKTSGLMKEGAPSAYRFELADPALFEQGRTPERVPACVQGRLDPPTGTPPDLAVAVNGKVQATGTAVRNAQGGLEFSLMVPEECIVTGRNEIHLFEVKDGALHPIQSR